MNVFVSYSHQDKIIAKKLDKELSKIGIKVWRYEEDIEAGQDIISKIESALRNANFFLVLLSKAAYNSNWVQREVNCRLIEDLSSGKESIIPVLLDDVSLPYLLKAVKWVDFRTSFHEGFEQLKSRILGITEDEAKYQNMFEKVYLLLLIDQFPNGIWGASLEKSSDLYGHKGDPGSITISTLSAFAITRFTGSFTSPPIQSFRDYLQSRQSKSGAFGMKREIGTVKYPRPQILEHGRHTAIALSFFLFYDGCGHYRVKKALDYLLNTRTSEGLWVDDGPLVKENVDPITVASVVDAFEQVCDAIKRKPSKNKQEEKMIIRLNEMILIGLNYIFGCPLRTSEGFWLYKYSSLEEKKRALQNLYQYTTDIISSIAVSVKRLDMYTSELDEIINKLFKITHRYKGGLPRSPETHVPSLDSTSRLILTARYLPRLQNQAQEIYKFLPDLCSDEQILTSGSANGWSGVLMLYGSPEAPFSRRSDERLVSINKIAQKLKIEDPSKVKIPLELEEFSDFVRKQLNRRSSLQPT